MTATKRSCRRRQSQRLLYIYVASISVTTFVVGFALGFSSPALPDMRYRAVLTNAEASWFASLLTVGGMIGSLAVSFTMEKFGRRGSLQLAGVMFIVSFGLICLSEEPRDLYWARLLAGASSGLTFAAAPAYISELSTKEQRGTLGTCTQLAITMGIACAFLIDAVFGAGYVALSGVGLVSSCLGLVLLLPLYDSPRWYVTRRRRNIAVAALTRLRGSSEAAESELAEFDSESTATSVSADETARGADMSADADADGNTTSASLGASADLQLLLDSGSKAESVASSVSRSASAGSLLAELRTVTFCRPIAVSVGLMAIQQFSGINAVLFYAADIMAATHSAMARQYGALAIAIAQVVATVFAASLMERAGRKQLLRASLITMAAGCFLLAVSCSAASSTHSGDTAVVDSANKSEGQKEAEAGAGSLKALLAVSALLVYIIGFSIGSGPIPMIVMSEIFDMRHRAVACGVTIFANWLFSFVVTLFFASVAATLGRATVYSAFGMVCLAGVVFVWRKVPETRGKTLEEIQSFFRMR